MRVHAIQTGVLQIKSAHRTLRGPEALRFPSILLDPTYTEPLPIYTWVIEHPEGLIVVDTGESAATATPDYFACDPVWANLQRWAGFIRFQVTPEHEIGPQLQRLGLSPNDVRWVILTHLHTDHGGGLSYFPKADIVVGRQEYEGHRQRPLGAIPCRWPSWFAPHLIDYPHSPVWPFPGAYRLTQAGDVHIVPTPGHSYGHQSLILQTHDVAYFFAGDTSFSEQQLQAKGLAGIVHDPRQARQTLQYINDYVELIPTVYLPSHDPEAGRRLAERRTVVECGC